MKRLRFFLSLSCLLTLLTAVGPADDSDGVVGTWLNGTKKGHIQIYKQGGTYFGKLVWLKEPNDPATGKPKTDIKNADAAKHGRPLLGLPLLYNFKYDGDKIWSDLQSRRWQRIQLQNDP